MAICSKCGSLVDEGQKFCPTCGAKQEETETKTEEKIDLSEKIANLNDTPDTTAEFDPADIEANKVYAILAYLGILVLIPIFVAKDSKFARFHANQGLVLAIVEIILSILCGIPLLGLIFVLLQIGCIVLAVIGILNAVKGLAKELPLIGKFVILK